MKLYNNKLGLIKLGTSKAEAMSYYSLWNLILRCSAGIFGIWVFRELTLTHLQQ